MAQYLNHKTLIEEGYLQEVNRQFFHPHGLALALVKNEPNAEGMLRIIDYREDKEGLVFDKSIDLQPKADNVYRLEGERYVDRRKAIGWWVQPVKP